MTFLDSIPFDRLLWLVPLFLTIHNLEEAPFMKGWSKRLPLKIHLTVSTRQFGIAASVLTLGGSLLTYYGVEYLSRQAGYLIVLGRALSEHVMTWRHFWILLGIAPFAIVIFALLSLQIGKALSR